jgi:hypothetical protein
LFFSVNAAYRTNGTWLVNDNTLEKIRHLTEQQPALTGYHGRRNDFVWSIRSSLTQLGQCQCLNLSNLFGDLSYFVVRRVTSGEYALVYNQSENLLEKGLATARYFARYDSNLICPGGGSPVSVLRMAVKVPAPRGALQLAEQGKPATAVHKTRTI